MSRIAAISNKCQVSLIKKHIPARLTISLRYKHTCTLHIIWLVQGLKYKSQFANNIYE